MTVKTETIDFSFRERLNQTLGGSHHNYCYQCGACVSYCPAARYYDGFNPRLIVLMTLFGLENELISPDSIIWKCTNCYTCYERCPQDVRPVEVITALKNICKEENKAPAIVDKYSDAILKTGFSAPVTTSIKSRREKFGLPEFQVKGLDELKELFDEEGE
jgi:heterodisulfide reductase subunit C